MLEQREKVIPLRVSEPARTRGTYLDHSLVNGRTGERTVLHSWAQHTYDRLRWAHGEDRARLIAIGEDPATNADLAAWSNLGRGGR